MTDNVTLYDVKCNHYASDIQAVKAIFYGASNYKIYLEIGMCLLHYALIINLYYSNTGIIICLK
jgi:hypothetical protein